jgi:hypothetical protein
LEWGCLCCGVSLICAARVVKAALRAASFAAMPACVGGAGAAGAGNGFGAGLLGSDFGVRLVGAGAGLPDALAFAGGVAQNGFIAWERAYGSSGASKKWLCIANCNCPRRFWRATPRNGLAPRGDRAPGAPTTPS